MHVVITDPSHAYLHGFPDHRMEALRNALAFTNESLKHQLKRIQRNHWFRNQNPVGWNEAVENLKAQVNQSALYTDDKGTFIRPGTIPYLDTTDWKIENKIAYPVLKKMPWKKMLPFTLYPYQQESWQKLLAEKHGNVSLCTGAGKSAIILQLIREAGLRVAVIAPSQSIFLELKKNIEKHLGAVGLYGDGRKSLGKKITVCISDSLVNIKPGTEEFEFFSNLDMIIVDESHTFAAETLETVCHGVLSKVPYRFFLSATQTRGDGTEKLLQSIIGRTVHHLSTAEAVEKGYISDHEFKIVPVFSSNGNFSSPDALEEKREHFLRNKNIAKFIAKLANADAKVNGKQTLVLVEELSQIKQLIALLDVPYVYAHSEKRKDRLEELGLQKVKADEAVDAFNANEAKVLIGTSCVATGTNIFPTHNTVNWVGGSSEIKTKQGAVGRSIRKHDANPWKNKCVQKDKAVIWDFDVLENFTMASHLEKRIEFYKESQRPIQYVKIPLGA